MPLVRGRLIPETESTGRVKRTLDVLLWRSGLSTSSLLSFDELEQLRQYLLHFDPPICLIRLFAATDDRGSLEGLESIGVEVSAVPKLEDFGAIPANVRDGLTDDLKAALSTALALDADCIVTDDLSLLPYVEDFETLNVLLTSPTFLLRYSELFVRGHDLPWSFTYKVWFEPWIAFYQLSEEWTFRPGIEFVNFCQTKAIDSAVVEVARSLSYNRLGDLCFTRDRLSFYEIQLSVAKRAQWKRQRFSAEIAYYLNFYYLLLYGAFDHAAVLVNGLLQLGIDERRVGARNQEFLIALRAKAPQVAAVFENNQYVEFLRRVAAVRHTAAHRGVVTPTKVIEEPAEEPTVAELDEDIREAGLESVVLHFPEGPSRESFREMLRTNARMARYERNTLMEDVVLVEFGGKHGFIKPLMDTWWNFKICLNFLHDVFAASANAIS